MTETILWVSIIFQFAAAGVALAMIPLTGKRLAWILIAIALVLMAVRRILGMLAVQSYFQNPLVLEGVGLMISTLMVIGVLKIREVFKDLHAMREMEKHQSEIIDLTADIIGTVNSRFELVFLNQAGRKFFGGPEEEDLQGCKLEALHSSQAWDLLLREAFPQALKTGHWFGENTILGPDGKELAVSQVVVAHPPIDGRVPLYSAVIRDITVQKTLLNDLEEVSRIRNRLLSILAHDLRGPMSGGISHLDELIQDLPQTKPEDLQSDLTLIRDTLQNQLQFIENLLAWTRSQFERFTIHPVTIDVAAAVDEAVSLFRVCAERKNIRIRTDIENGIHVIADHNIFEALLRNLLNNAIKFSHTDGEIFIRSSVKPDRVVVTVADQGIGMDADTLNLIRAGKPALSSLAGKNECGTGLGLSLCSRLIDRHREHNPLYGMAIESQPSSGTHVMLTLPRAEATSRQA